MQEGEKVVRKSGSQEVRKSGSKKVRKSERQEGRKVGVGLTGGGRSHRPYIWKRVLI